MEKCVVIYGKASVGKTETLKNLIALIKRNGYKIHKEEDRGDDRVIVAEVRGKKVGITSRGDSMDILADDFEWMGECDLYVCASRTKGQTVEFLKKNFSIILWQNRWNVLKNDYGFSFTSLYKDSQETQGKMLYDLIVNILL